MNEEETIERLKQCTDDIDDLCKCVFTGKHTCIGCREKAIKTILNLLKKKDKEIHCLEEEKQDAWEEWNNLEQSSYEEEKKLRIKIEKKDKIINSIKEYAQQEIDFATEDIRDYIDDDKEGNKNIIDELKEWREHWRDIIRIMSNEKTYMDFEYKLEEDK